MNFACALLGMFFERCVAVEVSSCVCYARSRCLPLSWLSSISVQESTIYASAVPGSMWCWGHFRIPVGLFVVWCEKGTTVKLSLNIISHEQRYHYKRLCKHAVVQCFLHLSFYAFWPSLKPDEVPWRNNAKPEIIAKRKHFRSQDIIQGVIDHKKTNLVFLPNFILGPGTLGFPIQSVGCRHTLQWHGKTQKMLRSQYLAG